jgi:predicted histone-like DNA-binding protein
MPIAYKIASKKSRDKAGNYVVKYCAVPTKRDLIGFRELARQISHRTTFSEADIHGALEAMQEAILDYIQEGNSVRLGDLGIFSASLGSDMKEKPEEVNIKAIKEARLVFRSSVFIKREMKKCKFVKAAKS